LLRKIEILSLRIVLLDLIALILQILKSLHVNLVITHLEQQVSVRFVQPATIVLIQQQINKLAQQEHIVILVRPTAKSVLLGSNVWTLKEEI
jgi:hypothetical protein